MKKAATLVACAAFALAAASANAQDKKDAMSKDKPMTMQECKDYMGMAAKDAKMKDAKKDTMCGDMMKKDGGMMKDGGAMKSDATKK